MDCEDILKTAKEYKEYLLEEGYPLFLTIIQVNHFISQALESKEMPTIINIKEPEE